MTQEVINYSRPYPPHRESVEVGFHQRHAPNVVRHVLTAAAADVPGVLVDPAPFAVPAEFGDSAIVYRLYYFITAGDLAREAGIRGEVMSRVWYAAQREGLELPFPIRTVFQTQVTASAAVEAEARALETRLGYLDSVPIFASLAENERRTLAAHMRPVEYAAGETILHQGEPGETLFVVRKGKVGVELFVEGAHRDVAELEAGAFFGEMSLLTGETRAATCIARNDVSAFVIDHHALQTVLAESPDVAGKLSEAVGRRQAELEGDREALSAEARARRAAETSSRLLLRIRDFFHLG
jgi:CRP-like cAMP-binding protein